MISVFHVRKSDWSGAFRCRLTRGYVTYVWFDALLNYYSAVADKPGIWPATFHVIGKDILVPPHAVYWPIMLHAAGLPLPKGIHRARLVAATAGAKMSKSTGNALNPLDLVTEFGADAFRYFVIREMNRRPGQRLHAASNSSCATTASSRITSATS